MCSPPLNQKRDKQRNRLKFLLLVKSMDGYLVNVLPGVTPYIFSFILIHYIF